MPGTPVPIRIPVEALPVTEPCIWVCFQLAVLMMWMLGRPAGGGSDLSVAQITRIGRTVKVSLRIQGPGMERGSLPSTAPAC